MKAAFLSEPWFKVLPRHKGYEQFAIILEKEKKYTDAIMLCSEAKDRGWNSDWDKRMLNLQRKIK